MDRSFTRHKDTVFVAQIQMGPNFNTHKEQLQHVFEDEVIKETSPDAIENILNATPEEFLTAKFRDTTVGGNDAINCYYQFNENDDIIHPINRVGTLDNQGLGRVYNEVFDEQQQILYLSFGIPEFVSAGDFLADAYNVELANLMNSGDVGLIKRASYFLGQVLGTVIVLPFLPIKYLMKAISFAGNAITGTWTRPTKYYDFRPTMALYYKLVNVILAHLAVNLDLAATEADVSKGQEDAIAGAPFLLARHGLDILTILSRKWNYDKLAKGEEIDDAHPTTDEMMDKLHADKLYEATGWTDGFSMGVTEAMKFVGWRIEKGVDNSESAGNSTKETEIARLINSQVSGGRDRTFNLAPIANSAPGSALKAAYDGIMGVVSGVTNSFNLQGGAEVLKGSGYIDIPEVWESSSFSKTYSFDFQLRTPMADKFSIFYSLYIPLAMLIAGAFPRSVGKNAYTSPFLVRAYCQGMFAIPLGIIDSITIKRGAAEYGWSRDLLPTQIDVSFSIKDLSPIMHIALADGGWADWASILGQNSTFQEYMLTLGGTNVANRTLRTRLIAARAKALLKISSNNKFNTTMIGFSMSNNVIGRALTAIWPSTRLPGYDE